ncbi:hypothetical protein RRG08_025892 [Elysia crispata]|uniref:Uncharacterized protein n=1 Tax=Elysia crispata TaxID=231223 RepID=A0AAE0ZQK0_9GAST|nr:hypothetical protein RRG08_025892 [Elysia crispata]
MHRSLAVPGVLNNQSSGSLTMPPIHLTRQSASLALGLGPKAEALSGDESRRGHTNLSDTTACDCSSLLLKINQKTTPLGDNQHRPHT